jgi:23S rRNA (uracil1939-C5)-methyltransferase
MTLNVPTSELADITIRNLASDGSGVGELPDGRIIFIPRSAPGDKTRVKVTALKRRWARGQLEEILRPTEKRSNPLCSLYDKCGGCSLQHIPYSDQLKWKGRFVSEALSRIGGLEVDKVPVTASPHLSQYRNRVTFTLRRLRAGRVVAGFHGLHRPSHVIDVRGECVLPEPEITSAWTSLRDHWGTGARRLPSGGRLRLTLRNSKSGIDLLIEGGTSAWNPEALMKHVSSVSTVWHQPSDAGAIELVYGRVHEDTWIGEQLLLVGDVFLQVNRAAAQLLQEHVIALAGSPDSAVDAYCGVGYYGRQLANSGTTVVGIDVNEAALTSSCEKRSDNYRTVQGAVEEHLSHFLPVDLLILNPPRSGLERTIPLQILDAPPKTIIYISCDPATLARDLNRLESAYVLAQYQGFDLFPQTAHIETVVVLRRSENQ